jgi:hypothetical protein
MSILTRRKTTESYLEKIVAVIPEKTWESTRAAIRNFIRFVKEKYQSSPDQIFQELLEIKKTKGDEEYEDTLYSILQAWIDWNILIKTGNYTIRTRFSSIKSYLYHLGVKTNSQDIKQLLKFPKKISEEKYPIKKQELRDLVTTQARNPKF